MTREEAINEIRSWDFLNGKEIEAVQTLIPELRESEEERMRKRAIAILKQQRDYWSYDGEIDKFPPATPRKDLVDAIDVALSYLEKQKEQKPADDDPLNDPRFIDGFDTGREVQKIFDEPAEWSEEDENKIESIKGLIITGRFDDTETIRIIWKLLDSLRPRPSWKPSAEQMRALQNAVTLTACDKDLARLYNQLKKL